MEKTQANYKEITHRTELEYPTKTSEVSMNDFSMIAGRAKLIASDLTKNTSGNIKHDIYVSAYLTEGDNTKFSIRLNEQENRYNNADFALAFFIVDELVKGNHVTTKSGLNLTKAKTQIFWPGIRNIQNIFQKFASEVVTANTDARKDILVTHIREWTKTMSIKKVS